MAEKIEERERTLKKGYVFGAGGVGVKAKEVIEKEKNTIIGFLDNDSLKWGGSLDNCPICDPKIVAEVQYDFIAIGVYKAVDAIKKQLQEMGVPESKIIVPVKPVKIYPNPMCFFPKQLELLDPFEYVSETTKEYEKKGVLIEDKELLDRLESLKSVLKENRIPREKVCVVGGAVLQVHGLRKSKKFDDIDIIMTSDLRKIYGTGLVIISETAEMHPQNEYTISDDEIIENYQYHFQFNDLKFACLEVLE